MPHTPENGKLLYLNTSAATAAAAAAAAAAMAGKHPLASCAAHTQTHQNTRQVRRAVGGRGRRSGVGGSSTFP